jgi:hypothetical protein
MTQMIRRLTLIFLSASSAAAISVICVPYLLNPTIIDRGEDVNEHGREEGQAEGDV